MNWLKKQGDAAAIGLGFWFGVALTVNLWSSIPAWIFVLTYVVGACWLTGWVLIGLKRFWNWLWTEIEYESRG